MTGLSLPAVFTLAVKVIDQIPTHSSVPTGVHAAVVNVGLTVGSLPSISTDALVSVDFINASTTIAAGTTFTVIDVLMAVRSCESLLTLAAEMPTGVASAAPVRTTHTRGEEARAAWSAVRRHGNRATVNHLTWCDEAVVFELGAVFAFVIFWTFTVVIRGQTKTLRSVLTRAALTVVHVQLTRDT